MHELLEIQESIGITTEDVLNELELLKFIDKSQIYHSDDVIKKAIYRYFLLRTNLHLSLTNFVLFHNLSNIV